MPIYAPGAEDDDEDESVDEAVELTTAGGWTGTICGTRNPLTQRMSHKAGLRRHNPWIVSFEWFKKQTSIIE